MQFTVISYNIHKGYVIGNTKFIINKIKEALNTTQTDILFLQEIIGDSTEAREKISDWPSNNQLEYLADSIWSHYAYGKNAVSDSKHYGNAILAKFPIIRYENLNISNNRFEKRGLLHAEVELPGESALLHLLNVHLDLLSKNRITQIEKIIRRIEDKHSPGEPIILAGDFNDWQEELSPILENSLGLKEAHLNHQGMHAKTFPSFWPSLKLDRIYYRNLNLLSAETLEKPPWSTLSDHVAVKSVFAWPPTSH